MDRQIALHIGQGQDDRTARIRDIQCDPVGRIGRVQRHISPARLLNRQCPDQQFSGTADIQPDQRAGTNTHGAQDMGDLVCSGIQGGVAERLPFEMQGHGVGGAGHLRLELLVDAEGLVIGHSGGVKSGNDLGKFIRRQ